MNPPHKINAIRFEPDQLPWIVSLVLACFGTVQGTSFYAQWPQGPSSDPNYFPLGVWLQDPVDAEAYRQAGINVYVGLWEGPTPEQLNCMAAAGMQTICAQNSIALQYRDASFSDGKPLIIGYMQIDEPDNCQPLPDGGWASSREGAKSSWAFLPLAESRR